METCATHMHIIYFYIVEAKHARNEHGKTLARRSTMSLYGVHWDRICRYVPWCTADKEPLSGFSTALLAPWRPRSSLGQELDSKSTGVSSLLVVTCWASNRGVTSDGHNVICSG